MFCMEEGAYELNKEICQKSSQLQGNGFSILCTICRRLVMNVHSFFCKQLEKFNLKHYLLIFHLLEK